MCDISALDPAMYIKPYTVTIYNTAAGFEKDK